MGCINKRDPYREKNFLLARLEIDIEDFDLYFDEHFESQILRNGLILQHTLKDPTHCNTLQHTAKYCNTLLTSGFFQLDSFFYF